MPLPVPVALGRLKAILAEGAASALAGDPKLKEANTLLSGPPRQMRLRRLRQLQRSEDGDEI